MREPVIARGLRRCRLRQFALWLAPWLGLLAFGAVGTWLCLVEGLGHTRMDNRFAFGLWIYLDLTIIALGAGAFFTGFLLYILRRRELSAVINSAVVLGFVCYSGAIAVLMVDVGQPLRAWFTFWHPNVHSMLTEVTFCLTCYLTVLMIEYLPIVLRHRQLRDVPAFLSLEHQLHRFMVVFAGVGTFLSFFHQGSLGGLYGVLRGRPFAFRDALGIWPTTFFLFILSAAAAGPSFVLVTTRLVEAITRRKLVKPEVPALLARISGSILIVYVLLKAVDTILWLNGTGPRTGFPASQFYSQGSFGISTLFIEIAVLGLLPALMLLNRRVRSNPRWRLLAALMTCAGVALNRFVMTIQTLALPTLPFDRFLSYVPSWEETAVFCGVLAYAVLVYSMSFRYLVLFPQERELQAAA